MSFLSIFGFRKADHRSRSHKKSRRSDQSPFTEQLDHIRQQELALKTKEEEIKRTISDVPMRIQEEEQKRRVLIRERAKATATSRSFGNPTHKIRSIAAKPLRRTGPEQSIALKQLLLLCAILLGILLLLWKSLP